MNNEHLFEYIEVESSNIKAIGYCPRFDLLSVTFHTGKEYWYFAFPAGKWVAFSTTDSYGRYFSMHIKDSYRYLNVSAFKENTLLDALEIIRMRDLGKGLTVEKFEKMCARYGLDPEETWGLILGRKEWYQYQTQDYKEQVARRVADLDFAALGYG